MDEFKPIEPTEEIITETHSSPEPMRQPVFESVVELDEKKYDDFNGNLMWRKSFFTGLLILAVILLHFIVFAVVYRSLTLYSVIMYGVLFLYFVLLLILRKRALKKGYEQLKYRAGDEGVSIRSCFFDDEFVVVGKKADDTKTYPYGDIKSVKAGDVLYLVELKLRTYALVDKKLGKPFEDFILEKATGVKKKKIGSVTFYRVLFYISMALCLAIAAAGLVLYLTRK